WFEGQIADETPAQSTTAALADVRIAIISNGNVTQASVFADLTQMIVKAGGTVLVSEQDALLKTDFVERLGITDKIYPSLAYAQQITEGGFHIMAMPTRDWGEILTGLGASGIELIVSMSEKPISGHPMIPVLQVSG